MHFDQLQRLITITLAMLLATVAAGLMFAGVNLRIVGEEAAINGQEILVPGLAYQEPQKFADLKKVQGDLYSRSINELMILTASGEPCKIIQCLSISNETAGVLASSILNLKQNQKMLFAAQLQGWGTTIAAALALASLIVSIIALIAPKT